MKHLSALHAIWGAHILRGTLIYNKLVESALRDSVVVANISSTSSSPAVMLIVQNFFRYLLNLATLILFVTALKSSFSEKC